MKTKQKMGYVVFNHFFNAVKHQVGKMSVHEQCEFVDRIKNRHLEMATAIMDVTNKKMVKSRIPEIQFNSYLEYLITNENYKDKFQTILEVLNLVEEYKPLQETLQENAKTRKAEEAKINEINIELEKEARERLQNKIVDIDLNTAPSTCEIPDTVKSSVCEIPVDINIKSNEQ